MIFYKTALLRAIALLMLSFTPLESVENPLVFSIRDWIKVPDGTLVAPFFNPKDCTSKLPWDLVDAYSIAAGEIKDESSICIKTKNYGKV